jgi:hypothetical protein
MEIMIALSKSDKSSDNVITRRVTVVEWLVTKPMGQRVDAEGGLLNKEDSKNTGVDESSHPVAPAKTGNKAREDHAHEDDDLDVVAMLPDNDGIVVQVGDVSTANALWVLLHDHPADVRIEKTFADRVWVLVGIGVSVVSSVISGPPSD